MFKTLLQIAELTRPGETTPARHRAAILLMAVGATGASFGGLFVRHLEQADGWQFNVYRGLVGGCMLLAILVFRYRRRSVQTFTSMSPAVWLGTVCLGFAAVFYILSLERTSVANAQLLLSVTPFLSAAFAWLFLREHLPRTTLLAMVLALVGVGLMVREGLATGNASGDLLALANVVLFATYSVIMRKNRMVDMLPAVVVASFVTMAIGLIGCSGDLEMTTNDLWLSVGWGIVIGIGGDWIFIIAVRHLTAAETTLLLMMIPSILGPLWVWWLIDEIPSSTTLAGGALVLAAVAGWALRELRSSAKE